MVQTKCTMIFGHFSGIEMFLLRYILACLILSSVSLQVFVSKIVMLLRFKPLLY